MKNGTAQEGFFARRGQAERDRQRREQRAIEDAERAARAPRLLADIAALQGPPADEPPAALLSPQAPIAMHATPATAAAANDVPPAGPVGTTVPDVFFDEIAPMLDNAELRCLLYLIRRTYGFQKREDRVSLAQFCRGIRHRDGSYLDHGTGLHHKSVIRALQSLEERELIAVVRDPREQPGGPRVSSYRLRLPNPGALSARAVSQSTSPSVTKREEAGALSARGSRLKRKQQQTVNNTQSTNSGQGTSRTRDPHAD